MEKIVRTLIGGGGDKYRKTKEDKDMIRMSEKVIKNHIVNHLPKIHFMLG